MVWWGEMEELYEEAVELRVVETDRISCVRRPPCLERVSAAVETKM